jgi:hypothetical protein
MTTGPRADRRGSHERIAAWLEGATDEELLELISDPDLSERGHSVVQLPRDAGTVFVKLVPIATLELASQNRGSTANIFGLPAYYQYRIGACGFGAWRDLEVHRRANEWVLSEQCGSFPLLHHWRVLPIVQTGYDDKRSLEPWGDCPEIHQRVSAVNDATSSAVLFLEYVPLTLGQWFQDQMKRADDPASFAIEIEEKLEQLLAFIHAKGLLHLDAHFENILTDGTRLYLTDYGLSLSRDFELGPDERAFFDQHQNFDLCTAINSLVHAVVTYYDSETAWRQTLRELVAGSQAAIDAAPDRIRSYLLTRAPLALAVGDFYDRLLADLTTPYPAAAFDELLAVTERHVGA